VAVNPSGQDATLRVLVSNAAAEKARALPESQRKAIAAALHDLEAGAPNGRPTQLPVPGRQGTALALRAGDPKTGPTLLYRTLDQDEGNSGVLVMAIVESKEWNGYLKAERSGELDTPEGRDLLLTQALDA
jgi:hypothetical protein